MTMMSRGYGLDACERALLDMVRHFLLAYTKHDHPHWETALELGSRYFGARNGPLTTFAVLDVIKALRTSRKTCFTFNNPRCGTCRNKLSDCERHLCRTLHFARNGERSRVRTEALILCEGFDTKALLAAVERLASLLPSLSPTRAMI
ncbi:MAG: hypothetical protein NXI27_06735 [Alphaproteobacteria bacterium]|nr:hypothetical protein [Alphaproteobacteria bacterium]